MAARRAVRYDDRASHAPDYLLLTVVLLLSVIGIIAVYSASYALGQRQFNDANYFVKRQAIFMVAGLLIMAVTMRLPYHVLMKLSPLIMLAAVVGLALVLVPGIGYEQNGARSWIRIGGIPPLQPSEFAKFGVIVYLAAWLTAKGDQLKDFSLGVVPFVAMVGFVAALINIFPANTAESRNCRSIRTRPCLSSSTGNATDIKPRRRRRALEESLPVASTRRVEN